MEDTYEVNDREYMYYSLNDKPIINTNILTLFFFKKFIFIIWVIFMDFLKYGVFIVLGITYFYILILSIKSRKPLKFLFLNTFSGIFIICLIRLTQKFTGVFLPINQYTIICSSTLGIPGIIGILILNFIVM